jgi:ABC-2 type transport system ATP-binding protein
MLQRIKSQRNLTVLITTHYMDEADKLCDRIAIVDHGKLVALDSPMMLKASIPGKNVLEVSFANAPADWAARLATLSFVDKIDAHGHIYRISSSNGPGTTLAVMDAAAAANVVVQSLSVQSTTLDDVFVHYTGRQLRDALQEASAADSPFMLRRG